jgi:hypothetical protein
VFETLFLERDRTIPVMVEDTCALSLFDMERISKP